MGVYGSLWGCGCLWGVFIWVPIDVYGFLDIYECLWVFMGLYECLWVFMGVYSFLFTAPWVSMGVMGVYGYS